MGLLTLSACIDGVESESVTAVRDAKTAELKSIAAMEKAEAEAMVALANAEAALKAADAAAQIAAAERAAALEELEALEQQLIELEKEYLTLTNEEAKKANEAAQARLEAEIEAQKVIKAEAEKELAELAAEMELAKVKNEEAILDAQLAMKKAKEELLDMEEALANAKTEAEKAELVARQNKLQAYSTAYSLALTDFVDATNTLNNYKKNLFDAMYGIDGLEDLKAQKEVAIAENLKLIALEEAKIASYQKYQNYRGDNYDELQALLDELADVYYIAQDKYYGAEALYLAEKVDLTKAEELYTALQENEFYKLMLPEYSSPMISYEYYHVELGENLTSYVYAYNWLTAGTEYKTTTNRTYEIDDVPYTYPVDTLYIAPAELKTDVRVALIEINDELDYAINDPDDGRDYWKREAARLKALYNGEPFTWEKDSKTEEWEQEPIEDAVNALDAVAAAKKEYDEAKTDEAKKAAQKKYEDALKARDLAKSEWDFAETQYNKKAGEVETYIQLIEYIENYDANVEALNDLVDEYNAAVAEANEISYDLWTKSMDAEVEFNAAAIEYNALYRVLAGYNPVDGTGDAALNASEIAEKIIACQNEIDRLVKENEDISAITTQEGIVAECQNDVDMQTIRVEAAEAALNAAKAAFDSLKAEEETPAA